MNIVKREKMRVIIMSCVGIVMGILFCVMPNTSLFVIRNVAAGFMICFGLFNFLMYFLTPILFRNSSLLISSIISFLFGVLILCVPAFLVFGIGFVFAIDGLQKISYSLEVKSMGDKKWSVDLVAGILIFVLGLASIILCNTNLASSIIMTYFGISIIVDGIINLILIFAFHRELKKIKKDIIDIDDYEIKK